MPVRVANQYINLTLMSEPQLDLLIAYVEQERANREARAPVVRASPPVVNTSSSSSVVRAQSRFERPTECSICCDEASASKLMVLKPCDHWICSDCFDRGSCVECPFCRVKLEMPSNVRRNHEQKTRERRNEVLEEYSRNLFGDVDRRRYRQRSPSPPPRRRQRQRIDRAFEHHEDDDEVQWLPGPPANFDRMLATILNRD